MWGGGRRGTLAPGGGSLLSSLSPCQARITSQMSPSWARGSYGTKFSLWSVSLGFLLPGNCIYVRGGGTCLAASPPDPMQTEFAKEGARERTNICTNELRRRVSVTKAEKLPSALGILTPLGRGPLPHSGSDICSQATAPEPSSSSPPRPTGRRRAMLRGRRRADCRRDFPRV